MTAQRIQNSNSTDKDWNPVTGNRNPRYGIQYPRLSLPRGWVRVGLLWDKQHETHIVRKKHIEISSVLKFGDNRAYIERDTAIQKLQNLLRNNRRPDNVSSNPYIS